jgi:hypothetical protein
MMKREKRDSTNRKESWELKDAISLWMSYSILSIKNGLSCCNTSCVISTLKRVLSQLLSQFFFSNNIYLDKFILLSILSIRCMLE